EGLQLIAERFGDIHEQTYGFKMDTVIEIVNIRAVAIGEIKSPSLPINKAGSEDASHAIIDAKHKAYFNNEFVNTPIYDRTKLQPNNKIQGPAILAQQD